MKKIKTPPALKDIKTAGKKRLGVLLPYQTRWTADQSQVKVIEKSRRVGISWAEAADDALYAASETGDDVWYIGYNHDMAMEFIDDCAMWAVQYQLAAADRKEIAIADTGKDILAFRIDFMSGNRITALSSRPTNLRGKHGRAVIDEAAFHNDLPGLMKAAMAFLIWGGSVRIISTHNGESNPYNELIEEIRAGKKPYSLHRVTFDDAIRDGLCRRIFEVLNRPYSKKAEKAWIEEIEAFYGEDKQEELYCVPSKGTGAWLHRALILKCMGKELPIFRIAMEDSFSESPTAVRESRIEAWLDAVVKPELMRFDRKMACFAGMDFGRLIDLSVLIVLQREQNLDMTASLSIEMRNMPFEQQRQIVFYVFDHLPKFYGAAFDARGNGAYLAEVAMQKYGANRIDQVALTNTWYMENMPPVKSALECESLLIPQDADVMDDMLLVRIENGIAKIPEARTKGYDGKKRHGDFAMALALGYYASMNITAGPVEFLAVKNKRRRGY